MKLEDKFFNSFFYPFFISVILCTLFATIFLSSYTNINYDDKTRNNIIDLEKQNSKMITVFL